MGLRKGAGPIESEAIQTMIETTELRKAFGEHVALESLNLSVRRGEVVGLLGPNGAGKSTLVKMLATLVKPTSGRIRVAGFDAATEPMNAKRRIGYVPETSALFDTLTGFEHLSMVVDLKGLPRSAGLRRVSELVDVLGLRDAVHDQLRDYSNGMRKKVLIASALLGNPDVLLLDEPMEGLDAPSTALLRTLLRELCRGYGVSVLLCSHVLGAVERACDRIYVLSQGVAVAEGAPAEVVAGVPGASDLEGAFIRLTGAPDTRVVAQRVLRTLR